MVKSTNRSRNDSDFPLRLPQFPAFSHNGSARCAPVDFNDLRRYAAWIVPSLNAAVCAFQAELVYTIGHPQTDRRCRGDPAAKKINMAVQKAEDMALPKGFCKSHCDYHFHLVNTGWVIVFLLGL